MAGFWLPSAWLAPKALLAGHELVEATPLFSGSWFHAILLTYTAPLQWLLYAGLITFVLFSLGARHPTEKYSGVNKNFPTYAIAFLLLACAQSFFAVVQAFPHNVQWQLQQHYGVQLNSSEQPITMQVKVVTIAQEQPWGWQFDGVLPAASNSSSWLPWHSPVARVRFTMPTTLSEQMPQPGSIWHLQVRVRPISGRLNEGGRRIQPYLLRQGVYYTGHVIAANVIEQPRSNPRFRLYQHLNQQRLQPLQQPSLAPIPNMASQPLLWHSDIMLALMVGERQWISRERWQLLQVTGLAHAMAISGLHLTLVFATSWWFGRLLLAAGWLLWPTQRPRQPTIDAGALLIALAVALFYAYLAGFAVATMRAFILVLLFSSARLFAWRLPPLRLLLRAVTLVLLLDPLAWLDAGFWLSVVAVTVIFSWNWRGPVWPLKWQPPAGVSRYLWQLLALEVVLTLALAPLSIAIFAGLPWIAPITNVLVLPIFSVILLPLILLAAAFILLQSMLGLPTESLSNGLLLAADVVLEAIFVALQWSINLPMPWLASSDMRVATLFLAVLFVLFWPSRVRVRVALLLLVLPLVHSAARPPTSAEFAVHVLDVGQGLAIVVQRERHALLFDAGPGFASGGDIGMSTLLPFLDYHRLTPEWLVISHDHRDHTGGVPALLQRWPQLRVMRSRFFIAEGENWGWQPEALPAAISDPQQWPCAWGQQWLWQGVRVRALAPLPGPSFGPNNDSCVLLLEYAGQRILLTGDAQQHTELRMVGRYGHSLKSDILVLGHHGSRTSTQVDFLVRVKPEVAVVSRGYRNSFQMPHNEVLQRLEMGQIPLYDTAQDGQVSFYFSSQGFNTRLFRKQIAPRWYLNVLPEPEK